MSPQFLRRATDEALGGRLASGEAAAFDELYRRYAHRLAAYGAHLLGDGASGEDVAQASLLKAYGALRAGRLPDTMRPWLYRIAHNTALDLVARRRELPSAELPDRGREDVLDRGALVEALGALPDRQRRVYVLREIHGLRIGETARELDLTVPQVEQSLFAARNRLAELLVFGERLSCVAVQQLAQGPLDGEERRGLKTHLRSCPACRRAVGRRTASLALLPLPSLDWLRGLAGLGGAPAAAKVGAAVATVTVAAGVPISLERRAALPPPPARQAAVGVAPSLLAPLRVAPTAGLAARPQTAATTLVRARRPPDDSHDGDREHPKSGGERHGDSEEATVERHEARERSASAASAEGRESSEAREPDETTARARLAPPSHEGGGGERTASVSSGGSGSSDLRESPESSGSDGRDTDGGGSDGGGSDDGGSDGGGSDGGGSDGGGSDDD